MEYMNPQLKNEYSKPTPRAIFRLHQTTMVDYRYYQFHTPQSWLRSFAAAVATNSSIVAYSGGKLRISCAKATI
jgi:hypothetical protein